MNSKQTDPDLAGARSKRSFQRALLRWYDRHRRDLPWRRTRDPYRIWISEIMLQQTRVAAVLEHYRLFLKHFPSVRALAAASEDEVLAAWSGLGYYRRARLLRLCAQRIVEDHNGRFPRNAEQLQSLPGLGRYTAAAIASIAFDEPVAVVDGNVERVLERLSGRELSPKETWDQAQALLANSRPGDHNQGMMELGAMVCTPRQPACHSCPIGNWCVTVGRRAEIETVERRAPSPGPPPTSRNAKPASRQTKKEIWCALAQRDRHIRLVQRAKNASLLAGMWELPQWPDLVAVQYRAQPWRTFKHSITTTDYRVHVFRDAMPRLARTKWVAIPRLAELPLTGLTRKILKAAGII